MAGSASIAATNAKSAGAKENVPSSIAIARNDAAKRHPRRAKRRMATEVKNAGDSRVTRLRR